MKLKTISYFDFKYHWIDNYSKGTYRFGQHVLNVCFKESGLEAEAIFPDYYRLWEEKDINKAEEMIFKLIDQYQWDLLNLQVIREDLL